MGMTDMLGVAAQGKRKPVKARTAKKTAEGACAVVIAAACVPAGMPVAPKSGRETREDMTQGCIHGLSRNACSACEELLGGRKPA